MPRRTPLTRVGWDTKVLVEEQEDDCHKDTFDAKFRLKAESSMAASDGGSLFEHASTLPLRNGCIFLAENEAEEVMSEALDYCWHRRYDLDVRASGLFREPACLFYFTPSEITTLIIGWCGRRKFHPVVVRIQLV